VNVFRRAAGAMLFALVAGCAVVPAGPAPEALRLQGELDRLHRDPRIAVNAIDELRDADAAVAMLAADGRRQGPLHEHRVYVAERLVQIAEAQGRARFAELRSRTLALERDRLALSLRDRQLQDAQARTATAQAAAVAGRGNGRIARSPAPEQPIEGDRSRAPARAPHEAGRANAAGSAAAPAGRALASSENGRL